MNLRFILASTLLFLWGTLLGGQNQDSRLFIPFLNRDSQSNVIVTVCDFAIGQPCPGEFTNVLTNTNLFTPGEQTLIREIFEKYRDVTTNSGPPGTVLAELHGTNQVSTTLDHKTNVELWQARFQYTNSEACEEMTFGRGALAAKFRTPANAGYNLYFMRTGNGTMLHLTEITNGVISGLLASFEDNHPQGTNWDFRNADFSDCRLTEYRRYRNGMVLGKFLVWDARQGNLLLEAEFKEPYDWNRNQLELKP